MQNQGELTSLQRALILVLSFFNSKCPVCASRLKIFFKTPRVSSGTSNCSVCGHQQNFGIRKCREDYYFSPLGSEKQ